MARYTITPLAAGDLREIAFFIEEKNPGRGISYVHEMRAVFDRYADMPLMGRPRPEIADDLRSFPFGNYVVFYRPTLNGIVVVRVLHGARDLSKISIPQY